MRAPRQVRNNRLAAYFEQIAVESMPLMVPLFADLVPLKLGARKVDSALGSGIDASFAGSENRSKRREFLTSPITHCGREFSTEIAEEKKRRAGREFFAHK
jgi:hypothetical protein